MTFVSSSSVQESVILRGSGQAKIAKRGEAHPHPLCASLRLRFAPFALNSFRFRSDLVAAFRLRWAIAGLILFVSGESLAQLSTGVVKKLDRVHEWTFMKLNSTVNHFDEVIGGADAFQGSDTNSEFRLTLYTEVKSGSVNEFSIDPSFSVDLNLPRIERRFHVFVNNYAPDSIPGESPLEQKRTTFIGVKQSIDWVKHLGLDTSAGIKWRLPPVLFGRFS